MRLTTKVRSTHMIEWGTVSPSLDVVADTG